MASLFYSQNQQINLILKNLTLYFLSFLLLTTTACKPRKKKCSRSYQIEHPVSVYPVKESYAIGDTIWFEPNFSDVFHVRYNNNFDGKSFNQTITLKNFEFYPTFIPFKKITDTTVNLAGNNVSGWPSFEAIYQPEYTQYEMYYGVQYVYKYTNAQYHYKLGIICKEKGRFVYFPVWTVFPNTNMACLAGLNEQDLTPECEKEIITDIRFPINKQPDGSHLTNYHLYEQIMHPDPAIEGTNIEFYKKECFTFIVK